MLTALLRLFGRHVPAEAPAPASFACESAPTMRNGRLLRPARGPVLMLDFDGVLHPAQSGSLIYLGELEDWLRCYPQVDVVISSIWRDSHTLEQLRAYFSDDIQPRVIGTTPNLEDGNREDEILALVQQYGITCWAALDDRAQEFPRTAGRHLVATEYFDGITAHSLARLVHTLGLAA